MHFKGWKWYQIYLIKPQIPCYLDKFNELYVQFKGWKWYSLYPFVIITYLSYNSLHKPFGIWYPWIVNNSKLSKWHQKYQKTVSATIEKVWISLKVWSIRLGWWSMRKFSIIINFSFNINFILEHRNIITMKNGLQKCRFWAMTWGHWKHFSAHDWT